MGAQKGNPNDLRTERKIDIISNAQCNLRSPYLELTG